MSLSLANYLDWTTGLYGMSNVQNNDTSTRFVVGGSINGTVHTAVFTIGQKL